jgi:hypothetical protein
MEFIAEDPLTQLAFSMFENKGVFALLLGSGLSRAAEIPTGWEITLDLVRRIALAQGVEDQTDWAEWKISRQRAELLDSARRTVFVSGRTPIHSAQLH